MKLSTSVVLYVVVLVMVGTSLPWLTYRLSPDSVSLHYHHLPRQTVLRVDARDQLNDDDDEEFKTENDYLKKLVRNKGKSLATSTKISRISDNGQPKRMASVFPAEDDPSYRLPTSVMRNPSHRGRVNPQGLDQNPREPSESLAHHLRRLLTQPTTSCRRLVRVGGRSCLGAYDGSKLVCLDEDVKLRPLNCLLYSFGVGNDFTFDEHMQDFGCEVHAFDHDNDHEIYDYRLGPTAFFHKARIGFKTGYFRFCEETPSRRTCEPVIRYQTMADIRKSLGHEDRRLDYLKMDVEGAEWQVLHQVLHNTTVLSTVSQVTLEIHLEELRSEKTPAGKRAAVASYIEVIQGLLKLGFQLVTHDENGLNPQYETVDGVRLSLYAELLFIRRNHTVETVYNLSLQDDGDKAFGDR